MDSANDSRANSHDASLTSDLGANRSRFRESTRSRDTREVDQIGGSKLAACEFETRG